MDDHKEGWAKRTDAFELWCSRTLESALDSKGDPTSNSKGNQPWILEGLMLKLKLQYFGLLMWKVSSLEKALMLAKTEGRGRTGVTENEMVGSHYPFSGHEPGGNSGRWWGKGRPGMMQSMGLQRVRHGLVIEHQQQRLYSGAWLVITCSAGSLYCVKRYPEEARHYNYWWMKMAIWVEGKALSVFLMQILH